MHWESISTSLPALCRKSPLFQTFKQSLLFQAVAVFSNALCHDMHRLQALRLFPFKYIRYILIVKIFSKNLQKRTMRAILDFRNAFEED